VNRDEAKRGIYRGIGDVHEAFDLMFGPYHCSECGKEIDESDQFWETRICERCAYEPTQSEEHDEWRADDLRRRAREIGR